MIVASNTSAILNLAIIDRLILLHQLYQRVIIPQSVYDEIIVAGEGQPGATVVKSTDWIKVRSVQNRVLATSLQLELDAGEADAITLAEELHADLLLIDERKGRAVANRLGIRHIGLLGVLVDAKKHGDLSAIKPVVDALISQAGFWISAQLYKQVLETAGE
jgi:uncharacterized protein